MRDTIDMARQVKATAYTNRHYPDRTTYTFGPEQLKDFEALARADEREQPTQPVAPVRPVANAAFSETIRRLREDHHTWRDSIDRCLEAAELLEKHLAPAAQPAVQEPDADALDGDIDLFDDARSILEIIVHDQPADLFRDARALIPKLRARIGMPPITTMTAAPRAVD